jgi:hypothetical protein
MNMLWSPSQSPAVKDICEHMSPTERRKAYGLAAGMGVWIAVCINAMMLTLVFRADLFWVVPLVGGLFVVGLTQFVKTQKRFLLGTARAVEKAYTREQL